jgi:hypothetical protein
LRTDHDFQTGARLTALAEQQLRLMSGWYGKAGDPPAGTKVKAVQ